MRGRRRFGSKTGVSIPCYGIPGPAHGRARRRAKAKLQLKLKTRPVEKLEPPPESPPELASGFDADVHGLIHEDEGAQTSPNPAPWTLHTHSDFPEVTVFPCTDLTIGTWRRMASPQHDLIAYTCESKRLLSWFIRSAGRSFKMDIFYDHILESRFANLSPGIGSATFLLDRPPTFYMENVADANSMEEPARFWQLCGDWTEGMQGTTHLRHCLIGPAYQLSALVNSITPSGAASDIALYTPTPSVSDAGSSPEVYTRSLHSPIEHMNGSTLVLRRPSSLSSLRMLHHPSIERLRPRTSVPHFHSPLSSTSTPNTPNSSYAPSDGSLSMSPTMLYLDGPGGYDQRQHSYMGQSGTGTPDQLTHLPLAMPNLPRAHYDFQSASRAESPYDEPPPSAVSTPGYFDVSSPTHPHPMNGPWGGAMPMQGPGMGGPLYVPQHPPAQERPEEPYYPYPTGLPGHPHAFPPDHGAPPGHGGC